jgi:hypothetical protein
VCIYVYSSIAVYFITCFSIVATNIAETSITVPHVRFVVDCGYAKQKTFDPARAIESLLIVPISQVYTLAHATINLR